MTEPNHPPPSARVRVEVLGTTDYMEAEQLSAIELLPDFIRAEGLDVDVYFREPGGMGLPPLETITLFLEGVGAGLAVDLAKDALKDAAKSALKGAIGWARERIRREPEEHRIAGEPERPVLVRLYGPTGRLLKMIEVTENGIDDPFPHPDVDDE